MKNRGFQIERILKGATLAVTTLFILSGCVTGQISELKKKRDKASANNPFYCQWINAERSVSVDLDINIRMAQKCDNSKDFTMTNFTAPNEQRGVMFCCVMNTSLSGSKISSKSSKMSKVKSTSGTKSSKTAKEKK